MHFLRAVVFCVFLITYFIRSHSRCWPCALSGTFLTCFVCGREWKVAGASWHPFQEQL